MRVRICPTMRCLALLALAACAGPSNERRTDRQQPAGIVDENEPVCKDEAPTGTILTRPVCRTRMQSEEDRRRAMELLSSPKRIGR
jgi:hypothetical protein